MLKKGAGAFKPKAPIARRRPAPAATAPVTATEPQIGPTTIQEITPNASCDADSSSNIVESRLEPPSQPALPDAPPEVPPPSSEPPASTTRARRTRSPEARRDAVVTKGPAAANSQASTIPSTNARPAPSDATHSEPLVQAGTTTRALPGQTENGSAPTQDPSEAPRSTSAQGAAAAVTKTKTTPRKGGPSALKPARSTPAKKAKSTAELTVPSPASTSEVASTPSASTSVAPSLDNGEGSSTTSTAKTRKPAATQPRKRKAPTVTAESEADTGTEAAGPPKKKRAPRKKKAAANGEESATQASGAENGEAAAPKKRAPRKKKTVAPAGNDEGGEGADGATPAETEGEESEKTKKARRKRSVTPEDAEQQKVDHEQMVMSELTRDLRIGAKFSKYDELRDRIRKKRARQRLIKLGKLQPGEEDLGENTSESGTPAPAPADGAKKPAQAVPRLIVEEAPADSVPQLEIVDGHIRINEASMQYDRHAAADQARGVVFEQEEDDFTTPVTQRTYMRRQPQGNFWTDEETIKFYHGLRMFGTDFNMISKMFGGAKNRRQVKLKFNREERANPVAINRCIIGEKDVPMDLDAVDGADALEDSQAITDELARLKEEQEAETRRQEEEEAATNRRKKDELFGRRKGDRAQPQKDHDAHDADLAGDPFGGAAKTNAAGDQYGVGTDPDVIDETDLPSAATARGRARGGGRARKAPQTFAGGIGG